MYKKSMINLLVSLAIGLGVAFSSMVWAKNPNMAVSKRDSNGDGKVSLSEWDKPEFVFNKIDLNGDGFITAQEFAKKWGIPMPGGSNNSSVGDAGSLDESNTIIADVHMHPMSQSPIEQLTWMNRNGVKWAGLGSMSRFKRERFTEVMKQRYIPFGGQGEMNKIFFQHGSDGVQDENNEIFELMMNDLEQEFESGNIKGIGELFGNNRTTNPKPNFRRKTRIDAPTYRAILDLVEKYGGAMSIHVQWDSDSVEQLGVLADHNPNGNIIWAHCGNDGSKYDKGIDNIRNGLLANLSQETAEKVAYKNAQRLLDLH